MNNNEENKERMSWPAYDHDAELKKYIDLIENIFKSYQSYGIDIINLNNDPLTLHEDGFNLLITGICVLDGILTVKNSSNPNKETFSIYDLKNIDNLQEIYERLNDILKNYDEQNELNSEEYKDFWGIDEDNELLKEEENELFGPTLEEYDSEDMCNCVSIECCNESGPCQAKNDIPDVYDYLTADMFPAEATEKDKYNKYVRKTPWMEIESYNESNKKIVDEYIKYFRENFPEKTKDKSDINILAENDDIWEHGLYDDILLNSLKNGDYVLDTCSNDGYKKGNLNGKNRHDVLANFDVVIDCTLAGYVCRPYIVFGISKQHSWMANAVDDDYTKEELRKISDLGGPKNDEELHWWRTEGVYKYYEREIELYKEGHVHFEIKDLGTEYRQYIRKVDHKAEKHKVTHDIW